MVILCKNPPGLLFLILKVVLLASSSLLLLDATVAPPDPFSFNPIYSNCSAPPYTANDPFKANLNTLLSTLSSNSPSSRFYNATAGTGLTDTAYGLFLCRGDLSHADCQRCVTAAATDILALCPARRQALVWYDYCALRYSDSDFFGVMDSGGIIMYNPNNLSTAAKPLEFVADLVKAAPQQRPLMFAANASSRHQMFAMAECTTDISSSDCGRCLESILGEIKNCCGQYQGWRFLAPSCSIRYESTPFLQNLNSFSSGFYGSVCYIEELPTGGRATSELSGLLASIPAEARPTGFYKTTVGDGADRLFGLALCRGDLGHGSPVCEACLSDAADDIEHNCHNGTHGTVWREKCMLRYSNRSFFGAVAGGGDAGEMWKCNSVPMSEADDISTSRMIDRLVAEASVAAEMFAAGEEALSESTGYGLVQCTRDLSSKDCMGCLRRGVSTVAAQCKRSKGWKYMSGSCAARFETDAFFNTSVLSVAPELAPAPGYDGVSPPPAQLGVKGAGHAWD